MVAKKVEDVKEQLAQMHSWLLTQMPNQENFSLFDSTASKNTIHDSVIRDFMTTLNSFIADNGNKAHTIELQKRIKNLKNSLESVFDHPSNISNTDLEHLRNLQQRLAAISKNVEFFKSASQPLEHNALNKGTGPRHIPVPNEAQQRRKQAFHKVEEERLNVLRTAGKKTKRI